MLVLSFKNIAAYPYFGSFVTSDNDDSCYIAAKIYNGNRRVFALDEFSVVGFHPEGLSSTYIMPLYAGLSTVYVFCQKKNVEFILRKKNHSNVTDKTARETAITTEKTRKSCFFFEKLTKIFG